MKIIIILLMLSTSFEVFSYSWEIISKTDAITDKISIEASVISKAGDRLTIIERDDKTKWAFFELSSPNQFSINERLILRVDKNKPMNYNADFQNLSRKLGNQIFTWEWNPNLIGFKVGSPGGCHNILTQIFNGKKMVIRYHPNKSTSKDVVFLLAGGEEAINKVISSKCGK